MNIINAIINLVNNPVITIHAHYVGRNRANSMGDALEEYIKDLFCGTFDETDEAKRIEKISKVFSYLGNNSNPPDGMLFGGDAIEVKKIESVNSALALNSSYPKHKLYADSPMISNACKTAENWTEKDIIYAVGIVNDNSLKHLTFVYGLDYAASDEIYSRIKMKIKDGVETIPDVEFADTKELGRVNKVDPLGITYLRVRGMWGIENPFSVFDYVYKRDFTKDFNFMCIINDEKFSTFANRQSLIDLCSTNTALSITDVKIKNPDNPAKLVNAKLITYTI
ncbi:MAG: NgoPII family restriction endonuclease [Oscillospiraceae bacterium]|nr:NgoPII family restriction endonuclease [Oscillospiraceae bacterium]